MSCTDWWQSINKLWRLYPNTNPHGMNFRCLSLASSSKILLPSWGSIECILHASVNLRCNWYQKLLGYWCPFQTESIAGFNYVVIIFDFFSISYVPWKFHGYLMFNITVYMVCLLSRGWHIINTLFQVIILWFNNHICSMCNVNMLVNFSEWIVYILLHR